MCRRQSEVCSSSELFWRRLRRWGAGSGALLLASGVQRQYLLQDVWLPRFFYRWLLLHRCYNLLCAFLGRLLPSCQWRCSIRQWRCSIRALQLGCCLEKARCFYRWNVHRICVPPRSFPLEVKAPPAPVCGPVFLYPLCGIVACWPELAGDATGVCSR